MLTKIHLENFTAFKNLDVEFSPGINVFIGANGTGKTHIMKAAYAACDVSFPGKNFADKLEKVFSPSNHQIGRLTRRAQKSSKSKIIVTRKINEEICNLTLAFSNHTKEFAKATITGAKTWGAAQIQSVFIPVKDMLANSPGFRSSYEQRELCFEAIYDDILARAQLKPLKGPADKNRKTLMEILQNAIAGDVIERSEEFFLKNDQGELEFSLLAEGFRKLGLLYKLIQNGTLLNGAVLFWDEPEANLNPTLMKTVVEILLALQQQGVQIFISTHDYVFLKWLTLLTDVSSGDNVIYHLIYQDTITKEVSKISTNNFYSISPNALVDTFSNLMFFELEKSLGGLGK